MDLRRRARAAARQDPTPSGVAVSLAAEGVRYAPPPGATGEDWFLTGEVDPSDAEVVGFASQLEELGFAEPQPDASLLVRWPHVYRVLADEDLRPTAAVFPVPPTD